MTSAPPNSLKRPRDDNKSSPTPPKRPRPSHQSSSNMSSRKPTIAIQDIIALPETEVWSLAKKDLRSYFLALQEYSRNPQQVTHLVSLPGPPSQNEGAKEIAPFLRLPLEIREQIYKYLLPPPVSQPILGPHPRQLQNSIHLSQLIPASILLLNRQIHDEALPLFYGSPDQVVSIKIDYNIVCISFPVLTHALNRSLRHLCRYETP